MNVSIVDFEQVNVSWVYNCTCIYGYWCLSTNTDFFFLENPPSPEEQFLQCLVYVIFSFVFFSSYFSCASAQSLASCFFFSMNFFSAFWKLVQQLRKITQKTFKDLMKSDLQNLTCLIQFELRKWKQRRDVLMNEFRKLSQILEKLLCEGGNFEVK